MIFVVRESSSSKVSVDCGVLNKASGLPKHFSLFVNASAPVRASDLSRAPVICMDI